jgi:hypothetical protein
MLSSLKVPQLPSVSLPTVLFTARKACREAVLFCGVLHKKRLSACACAPGQPM